MMKYCELETKHKACSGKALKHIKHSLLKLSNSYMVEEEAIKARETSEKIFSGEIVQDMPTIIVADFFW